MEFSRVIAFFCQIAIDQILSFSNLRLSNTIITMQISFEECSNLREKPLAK